MPLFLRLRAERIVKAGTADIVQEALLRSAPTECRSIILLIAYCGVCRLAGYVRYSLSS